MAVDTKPGKKSKTTAPGKKPVKSLFDEKPKQDDLTQLWQDVRERPLVYGGIAAFLVVCLLAGFLYRANAVSGRKNVMTAYAQALDKEEPADQFAALEPLSLSAGKKVDEVVYVTGETAYRAGQYDKAQAAFDRVRAEFKDSPYAPEAVEGLGYIAENAKDYDNALTYYKEVRDTWATSFAARRQPMNIAKMEERRGRLAEAVAAYREQMQVFPGSSLATESSAALTRLEKSDPDLFPKAEAPAPLPAELGEAPASDAAKTPDLEMQLKTPDATGASPLPSETGLDLKLKMPEVGTDAPAQSPPVEPAPAPVP